MAKGDVAKRRAIEIRGFKAKVDNGHYKEQVGNPGSVLCNMAAMYHNKYLCDLDDFNENRLYDVIGLLITSGYLKFEKDEIVNIVEDSKLIAVGL